MHRAIVTPSRRLSGRIHLRRLLGIALVAALLGLTLEAAAFPGVCIGKDPTPRFVHATQIVVMRNAAVTAVTIMIDYEGPLAPFALLFPVPADVEARDVKTVRRGVIRRLEQLSAPRFHAFYEHDPCATGAFEQDWDERMEVSGRGFLTPPELPTPEGRYAVPNLISAPIEPMFKRAENEFVYGVFPAQDAAMLSRLLTERGYHVSQATLDAFAPYLGASKRILMAEVRLEHVEILGPNRAQLGGVRYFTKRPHPGLPVRLGATNSKGQQDLLIYVLDPARRYQAAKYENLFLPTNVVVPPDSGRELRRVHNEAFDRARRGRSAFVTEYAWSTKGCGQPCPDAPLGLDELMTLGGDVLHPRSSAALRRRTSPRDELARRNALLAQHEYVLSRLHHRYTPAELPWDVELVEAAAMRGGTGVPSGPSGELSRTAHPGDRNELQVRYVSLHSWRGPASCLEPLRFRWGKRWATEARATRAVPLALDLFEPLGAVASRQSPAPVPPSSPGRRGDAGQDRKATSPARAPARRSPSCAAGSGADEGNAWPGALCFLVTAISRGVRRRRKRTPARKFVMFRRWPHLEPSSPAAKPPRRARQRALGGCAR